jgi:hypothetical protein
MNSIEQYEKIFEKRNKLEFFEVNKPFLENMILTKNRIDQLSKEKLVLVHPTNPNIQKTSENGKMFLKLQQLYKDQTVALNKILGNDSEEDFNFFPNEEDYDD